MPVFLDACALVKHFVPEAGSADVSAVLASSVNVAVSEWTVVEGVSAFARKARKREIDPADFAPLVEALVRFCASGRLQVVSVSPDRISEAIDLLCLHGLTVGLRAGDSLQLATAKRAATLPGFTPLAFHTSDARLEKAATADGFVTPDLLT